MNENKKEIDDIANWYESKNGFSKDWPNLYKKYVLFRYLAIKSFLKGKNILEVGFAMGDMTEYLFNHFNMIIGLEASKNFIKIVKKRFFDFYKEGRLIVIHSFIEEYNTDKKFDIILISHVLEHLEEPVRILKKIKNWLNDNGKLIILVPNANSLHRQVGVEMGLLNKIDDLNEQDIKLGHKRVYTLESLKEQIKKAGLILESSGGYFLKPLANNQIEKWFNDKMIEAFFELGKKYCDLSVEIYAVCRN